MAGALIGVGVGPGDPDLMTLAALRALRRADRVVAPTLALDAVGRAETVVRQAAPDIAVERLVFSMDPADENARSGSHHRAAARLLPSLDAGQEVAFVTLGDPNVYSTFPSLAHAVSAARPDVTVATVPGITAFQDLASRTGTVLLDGTEQLGLVTALDGPDQLRHALDQGDRAVVVYKGGRHLPSVLEALAQCGRLEGAVAGELLGLPGERIGPAASFGDGPAAYLVTVIVPPVARLGSRT